MACAAEHGSDRSVLQFRCTITLSEEHIERGTRRARNTSSEEHVERGFLGPAKLGGRRKHSQNPIALEHQFSGFSAITSLMDLFGQRSSHFSWRRRARTGTRRSQWSSPTEAWTPSEPWEFCRETPDVSGDNASAFSKRLRYGGSWRHHASRSPKCEVWRALDRRTSKQNAQMSRPVSECGEHSPALIAGLPRDLNSSMPASGIHSGRWLRLYCESAKLDAGIHGDRCCGSYTFSRR